LGNEERSLATPPLARAVAHSSPARAVNSARASSSAPPPVKASTRTAPKALSPPEACRVGASRGGRATSPSREPPSRGVTVPFRVLRPDLVALVVGSERSPHVRCPCETGLRGFPQPGPPLERELERASRVGFDSPSEFSVGAPPDSALAVFPPALAGGSGPPLLEFPVPTAFQSQVPRSSTIGETDRGRRELPRSRRCRPRALSAPRRFELPRPARTRVAPCPHEPRFPQDLRSPIPCRRRPWDFPYRAFPSRRAVPPLDGRLLPCGFGDSTPNSGAKAPGISRPVSPRRRPRAAPPNPRKGPETRRRGRDLGSSRSLGHLSTTVTRSNLGSRPASFGLAGSLPDRPLRSLAPSENPFTDDRAVAQACARTSARPPGRCSPGISPL